MTGEKAVERMLCEGVRKLGGLALKWVSPGCTGVPDRLVLLPDGRVCFVELKTDSGALSARQRYMLHQLTCLGFRVWVLYGREDVRRFLNRLGGDGECAMPE